jgi:hypothetical protein
VAQRWEQEREKNPGVLGKEPKAGFRAQVARDVFAALSDTERAAFATRAKEEAIKARADYLAALKKPASTAPADRQRSAFFLPAVLALTEDASDASTLLVISLHRFCVG